MNHLRKTCCTTDKQDHYNAILCFSVVNFKTTLTFHQLVSFLLGERYLALYYVHNDFIVVKVLRKFYFAFLFRFKQIFYRYYPVMLFV